VQFGRVGAVEKSLMRQQWGAWFPPAAEATSPFVIRFDNVPLVRGVLEGEGGQR
jgi:hypothetical protein